MTHHPKHPQCPQCGLRHAPVPEETYRSFVIIEVEVDPHDQPRWMRRAEETAAKDRRWDG